MSPPAHTFVDPRVSRAKFERDVAEYRAREEQHWQRGWWLLRAGFPTVFAVFGAPSVGWVANNPSIRMVVFAVVLDFTNYDVWPPSVKFVNPFTRSPLKGTELPHPFVRRTTKQGTGPGGQPLEFNELAPLVQHWERGDEPFFCLPGVREYHDNPGHSGDPWLMHRGGGEGSLFFIFDQLSRYGSEPVRGVQWQFQATPVALNVPEFPT